MLEKDFGKEKNSPEFSALAQIYDRANDIHFIKLIKTTVNSDSLREFAIDAKEDPKKSLTIRVRVDSSDQGLKPNVIIKNHDGREIIYMLKERFDKKLGMKYFSLGSSPQDIHTGKAVKADFKVFLDVGKEIIIPIIPNSSDKPLLA